MIQYKTKNWAHKFNSVQFSHSVMSDSLGPHGLQHARSPCPSTISRVYLNSCPSSQWCHPTISSSATPFTSCPQSSPEWGSFPMNRLFASGGRSIGASGSASILPMNIQDWFPLGLTGLILFQSKGLKNLLQHHSSKASVLQHSTFFIVQLSHQYLTTATQNVFQLVSNVGTPKTAFDVTLATVARMHAC